VLVRGSKCIPYWFCQHAIFLQIHVGNGQEECWTIN
jgi:hypothetical protein